MRMYEIENETQKEVGLKFTFIERIVILFLGRLVCTFDTTDRETTL